MGELLSVIISNYNKEAYLEQCICSVISQNYRPIEVLVVDDCSQDASRTLLTELAARFQEVRLVFLDTNQGVSNARNEGIRQAKGKYITVLDADDFYWNNKKLEYEMELLYKIENQGEENAVAFSNLIAVNKEGKFLWKYKTRSFFQGESMRKMILSGRNMHYPREYCFRKELHDKIGGYNTGMSLYEDLDYLLRLSKYSNFYCTNEIGNAYRITYEGLSSVSGKKTKRVLEELCRQYRKDYPVYIRSVFKIVNIMNYVKNVIKQKIRLMLIKAGLWKPKA